MLVGLLMVSVGAVFVYAGVTGLSVQALLLGDNTTLSKTAQGTVVTASKVPDGAQSSGAGGTAAAHPGATAPPPPSGHPSGGVPPITTYPPIPRVSPTGTNIFQ